MIEISLTQGQVALIDDEDFELVSKYTWYAHWNPKTKSFYARTNTRKVDGKWPILQMHRLIMNAQPGEEVDHIHHSTLDNRKSELRLCTGSQNQHNRGLQTNNTSGYKGLCWFKQRQKWQANIMLNGKKKHLGYFTTPELAHEAYCKAAHELHGSFARVA
ncbi:MAG TPA: AP2 domain-containing protein [Acidithiobacillus sp.]|nr:AP2 domain-containing protein [Acidithiobacillus sp.]